MVILYSIDNQGLPDSDSGVARFHLASQKEECKSITKSITIVVDYQRHTAKTIENAIAFNCRFRLIHCKPRF
jgi:hypothetical protein